MTTKKNYTVKEANQALPLVSVIVRDLTQLSLEIAERRQRISQLNEHQDADSLYAEEVNQAQQHLNESERELRRFEKELEQLGVLCSDTREGVVDFPAIMDDQPIYLNWRQGEPEVSYWRTVDSELGDRHRLPAHAGS